LQEYIDVEAFDIHCEADYVTNFVKKYIEDENTSIVYAPFSSKLTKGA